MASGNEANEIKAVVNRSIYKDSYTLTDWYCPACGKKAVWEEDGEGDYYLGQSYICANCGGSMNFPDIGNKPPHPADSRVMQLRPFTPPERL